MAYCLARWERETKFNEQCKFYSTFNEGGVKCQKRQFHRLETPITHTHTHPHATLSCDENQYLVWPPRAYMRCWSKSGSDLGLSVPLILEESHEMCECVVWRDISLWPNHTWPRWTQIPYSNRTIHVHTLLGLQQVTFSRTRSVWYSGHGHAHRIWIPLSICGISGGGQYRRKPQTRTS